MPLEKDKEFRSQLPPHLRMAADLEKNQLDDLYDGGYVDRRTMELFTDGLKEYYLDLAKDHND